MLVASKSWIKGLKAWIESLVIVILFVLASFLLQDSLSLTSPFPWIWFGPILIALRYGLWPAQASILILIGVYLYHDLNPIFTTSFQLFILGGFLLTVVCGIFQNRWGKKIADDRAISDYLQTRIQSIADAYNVIALSYQRLEQQYIIKPVTLRSSLSQLREMLAHQKKDSLEIIYDRFLNLLALHGSIEIAAIFPVKDKKISFKPIASIGNVKQPKKDDYLLVSCIENSAITFVKAKSILHGHFSDYLLVAPFLNQTNDIEAILLIESMPFLSLNDENIGMIEVLMQYFSGGHVVKDADLILTEYPECPVDFANELQRLMRLQKNTLRDSAVLAFKLLPHPHQKDYLFKLRMEQRGLDTLWEITQNDYTVLLIIMPITGHAGVESYKIRINQIFVNEFETVLNGDLIKIKTCQMSAFNEPIHLIRDLLT